MCASCVCVRVGGDRGKGVRVLGGCRPGSLLLLHGQFQARGPDDGCLVCVLVLGIWFFFVFGFSTREAWVPKEADSSWGAGM